VGLPIFISLPCVKGGGAV